MKKIVFFPFVLCVFLLNIAGTCCDDDPIVVNTVAKSPESISAALDKGTWKITYFFDAKTNKSSSFSGYNFTFGPSDILIANNTSLEYSGKWSITKSDVADNNPNNDIDFAISFSSPTGFVDLSHEWDIVDITATQVRLRGVNSNNEQTDYLTFEKN